MSQIQTDGHERPSSAKHVTSESGTREVTQFSTDNWHTAGEDSIAPDSIQDDNIHPLQRSRTMTLLGGRLKLRSKDDDDPSDWWFASTAIPLIAATFAPMANMLSIAALVVNWRNITTTDDPLTKYQTSYGRPDPHWALNLNGASLACGFVGNVFLLCNFTQKIRYIIALPATILFFYVASSILTGITIAMNVYEPPEAGQVYSQGYWHAIIAACLYMFCGMLLMINMLGYFLGHYPQHFDLTDEQRNLILQTMIFFIWLSGGAGVFSYIEKWDYPDALYFCDVTLLTIGFGDFYATNDLGRGLVFPFSVGGTIILGLMVSSIHKFAQELSRDKVVKKHIESARVDTLSRVATLHGDSSKTTNSSSSHQGVHEAGLQANREKVADRTSSLQAPSVPLSRKNTTLSKVTSVLLPSRTQKAILMYSERDRFNKMREIQYAAKRFKKWYALTLSIISFGLLWCVGAMVFMFCESQTQDLTYFQGLYFCYVSLLTIGYGDLSPRSNAGKPFFVLWSLIAVPTMTILISDLGDTAISSFKRKVLEYGGLAFLGKGRGWGLDWFVKRKVNMQRRLSAVGLSHERASRTESGSGGRLSFSLVRRLSVSNGGDMEPHVPPITIDELLKEDLSRPEMLKRLAYALRSVANDLKNSSHKRYSYEEWVEFTRLIRFTKLDGTGTDDSGRRLEYDEAVDGVVEWDWLDTNSPMTSEQSEVEWVMDRLLESLLRTFKRADITEQLAKLSQPAPRMLTDGTEDSADPDEWADEEKRRPSQESIDGSPRHKRRLRHHNHTGAHVPRHGVTFHRRTKGGLRHGGSSSSSSRE